MAAAAPARPAQATVRTASTITTPDGTEIFFKDRGDPRGQPVAMRSSKLITGAVLKGDFATTSLLESWIDEVEQRCWLLTQALRVP